MKTKIAIFLAAAIFCCIANTQAQTVVKPNEQGVYKSVTVTSNAPVKGKDTGKFYEDSKGNLYPIFVTPTGAHYINRISKNTGKPYKQYLKL